MGAKKLVQESFPLKPGYRRVLVTVKCRIQMEGHLEVVADVPEDLPDRCVANSVIEACKSNRFDDVTEHTSNSQISNFIVWGIESANSNVIPMMRVVTDNSLNHRILDTHSYPW